MEPSPVYVGLHLLQRPSGTLVSQLLGSKRLPELVSSQKMSGSFRRIVLPMTVLSVGGVPSKPLITTPPEKALGPDGTLSRTWLPLISIPCAPRGRALAGDDHTLHVEEGALEDHLPLPLYYQALALLGDRDPETFYKYLAQNPIYRTRDSCFTRGLSTTAWTYRVRFKDCMGLFVWRIPCGCTGAS
jgi:hypothetical protein